VLDPLEPELPPLAPEEPGLSVPLEPEEPELPPLMSLEPVPDDEPDFLCFFFFVWSDVPPVVPEDPVLWSLDIEEPEDPVPL